MNEPFSSLGVDRQACINAILNRRPMDVYGQIECARNGWSGNTSWLKPEPLPANIDRAQLMVNRQAIDPHTSLPLSPLPPVDVRQTFPSLIPPAPNRDCDINETIANNPGLALLVLLGIWLIK